MFSYIIFCITSNLTIFGIPIFVLFCKMNYYREKEGKSFVSDDTLILLGTFLAFIYFACLGFTCNLFFGHNIETKYRFTNPIIVILFVLCLSVCVFLIVKMSLVIKNSFYRKNYNRKINIAEKIRLVNRYINYFNKKLVSESITKVEEDSINEVVKLLKEIRTELMLSYNALDVNIISEVFKDIELEANSLDALQKEVDRMKSFRSLSELSSELEGLMKKYDK